MYHSPGITSTQWRVLKTRFETGGKKKKHSMRKMFHERLMNACRMRCALAVFCRCPSLQQSDCVDRMARHVSGTAVRMRVAESTVEKSPS